MCNARKQESLRPADLTLWNRCFTSFTFLRSLYYSVTHILRTPTVFFRVSLSLSLSASTDSHSPTLWQVADESISLFRSVPPFNICIFTSVRLESTCSPVLQQVAGPCSMNLPKHTYTYIWICIHEYVRMLRTVMNQSCVSSRLNLQLILLTLLSSLAA